MIKAVMIEGRTKLEMSGDMSDITADVVLLIENIMTAMSKVAPSGLFDFLKSEVLKVVSEIVSEKSEKNGSKNHV